MGTPLSQSTSLLRTQMRPTVLTTRPCMTSASVLSSSPHQPTVISTIWCLLPCLVSPPACDSQVSSTLISVSLRSTWCPSLVSISSCLALLLSLPVVASSTVPSLCPSSPSRCSTPRT